ncbi:hypothetical protein ACLKA6_014347 [Drosophila palustris]
MSLSSDGEFRAVLQQYKFGLHKIYCVIKILPDKVRLFGREPETDFNWMTTARWAKLESSLWRLFTGVNDWKQDTRKLKTKMHVDHMEVSLRATEKFLTAAQTLLKNETLTANDLELEIVLKYMSHEDATVDGAQPKKRKHDKETKATQVEMDCDLRSISRNSSDSDKAKRLKLRDDEHKIKESMKQSISTAIARKRERRSISHDSHRQKDTPKKAPTTRRSGSGSRTPKRSSSPPLRTKCNESKAERRSARSPKRPINYNETAFSQRKTQSSKTNVDTNSDKKSTKRQQSTRNKGGTAAVTNGNGNGTSAAWELQQIDGARINVDALKKINEMLDVPKPRKVEILLLKDMDEATVLSTFETYREDFDRLFKERQHKFQTISYMSIDHCHCMDILSKTIRDNMIKKLGEVYSKSGPHGTLVINGLLPLWIIRLFMDKYKFSHDEAVRQIADQLKYNTYLKAVNNEPLSSDLDE